MNKHTKNVFIINSPKDVFLNQSHHQVTSLKNIRFMFIIISDLFFYCKFKEKYFFIIYIIKKKKDYSEE